VNGDPHVLAGAHRPQGLAQGCLEPPNADLPHVVTLLRDEATAGCLGWLAECPYGLRKSGWSHRRSSRVALVVARNGKNDETIPPTIVMHGSLDAMASVTVAREKAHAGKDHKRRGSRLDIPVTSHDSLGSSLAPSLVKRLSGYDPRRVRK
jgi:hypothetical protein